MRAGRVRAGAAITLALALGVAAACSDDDDEPAATGATVTAASGPTSPPASAATTAPPGTTAALPTPAPDLGAVELATTEVARLEQPVALALRPGDPALYFAERPGRVRALRPGSGEAELVLDLSADTVARGEQGLLGLAFSPEGDRLYVHFTDRAGDTRLQELTVAGDGTVDRASRRELLSVDQPFANHNGGQLLFGPDGMLYLGLGDGGSAGDPDGRAQRLDTLLGKVLRIDPSRGDPYAIPAGNPFADRDDARPEIWAYGLRNPWRFSFDRATGDLWIADVGQNAVEEINRVPAAPDGAGRGANFGWDRFEGDDEFEGGDREGLIFPVFTYGHDEGCSVTGGFVYRGSDIPVLAGAYVFADYCDRWLRAIRVDEQGAVVEERRFELDLRNVVSFGEDQDGELYLLTLDGPVLRLVAT